MFEWFANTLRTYPEIAIFISLAFGYYFGSFTYKGLGLGAVTATLIAAVIIGQLGITVTGPLKPFFFLMFLFAIGYAVGPQFVRGIAKDGLAPGLVRGGRRACSACCPRSWSPSSPAMTSAPLWASMPARRRSRRRWASAPMPSTALGSAGRNQEPPRCHAGRLCGHLHLRHGRLGDHHRLARPGPARHQPRRGVQALRGEARRQEGGRRTRHGLAPVRPARLPRPAGRPDRRA